MAQAQPITRATTPPKIPTRVTLEEYLELYDDAPIEVIDGELNLMSPQHFKNSYRARKLFLSFNDHLKGSSLGDVLTETVFALDIEPGANWVTGSLVPDVAFISTERLREQIEKYPDESAFRVPPDLAVEIISPTDKFSIVLKKVARYLKYGVRLVWVIDPQNRVIYVYTPDQPDGRALHENETVTADPILPEWSMAVRELLDAGPELE